MAVTLSEVTKLYVATFNRAPDAAGINYWANSGMSIENIAQSFFDQPETQSLYPSSTANSSFVASVYANLFNRAPDTDGLNYWVQELDSGSVSKQNFILAVINGAQNTDISQDATILTNKQTVGLDFVAKGLDDVTLARSVMANVDATQTSVDSALGEINTAANTLSLEGLTFTLTDAYSVSDFRIVDADTAVQTWVETDSGYSDSATFNYTIDGLVVTMSNNEETIVYTFPDAHLDNGDVAQVHSLTEGFTANITVSNVIRDVPEADIPEDEVSLDGFKFTTEWLNGKTLYDVYGEESGFSAGDRHLYNDITTLTFNNNGSFAATNGQESATGTWSVDSANTISIVIPGEDNWYIRASGETIVPNAYVVYTEDVYSRFLTNDFYSPEAITTDYATAVSIVGTSLPAENVFQI